jgi:hypothetical protein
VSPRGGDAFRAFEVETLDEKAGRLNREQGLPDDFQHPDLPRGARETEGLRHAAEWLVRAGYPHDVGIAEHPPADVWEAIVDAVHTDPDGNLHGNSLSREEVDAWMRYEAGRPDDATEEGA